MDVEQAIRTRRSHKLFTGETLPDAELRRLVELATWAPNHKFTEPWRFSVLPQDHFAGLHAAIDASVDSPKAAEKAAKIHGIVNGAGACIAVRQVRSPQDAERDREDYAACCCAIQNIQLAAWASGWASFWTTSVGWLGGPLRAFWHCAADEDIVGVIVLGQAAMDMPAIRHKTLDEVTTWL